MPAGRPREHNREQIAIDIIEWARKDNNMNLNKFCCLYSPPFSPQKLSEWAKETEEFREAYDITKAFIAFRREEKLNLGELHVKAYDLNAATYDYFIREERRAQSAYEAELKTQADNVVDERIMESYKATMNQLQRLQSERKIEDNKISKEQ